MTPEVTDKVDLQYKEKYKAALSRARLSYAIAVGSCQSGDESSELHAHFKDRIDLLEAIFGKSELYPEPEINTWDDLVKAGKAFTKVISAIEDGDDKDEEFRPIDYKLIATDKITQLIDTMYGGVVTWNDRCNDDNYDTLYEIVIDEYMQPKIECFETKVPQGSLVFHTYNQAERFLKYNKDLIKDYYMLFK